MDVPLPWVRAGSPGPCGAVPSVVLSRYGAGPATAGRGSTPRCWDAGPSVLLSRCGGVRASAAFRVGTRRCTSGPSPVCRSICGAAWPDAAPGAGPVAYCARAGVAPIAAKSAKAGRVKRFVVRFRAWRSARCLSAARQHAAGRLSQPLPRITTYRDGENGVGGNERALLGTLALTVGFNGTASSRPFAHTTAAPQPMAVS